MSKRRKEEEIEWVFAQLRRQVAELHRLERARLVANHSDDGRSVAA